MLLCHFSLITRYIWQHVLTLGIEKCHIFESVYNLFLIMILCLHRVLIFSTYVNFVVQKIEALKMFRPLLQLILYLRDTIGIITVIINNITAIVTVTLAELAYYCIHGDLFLSVIAQVLLSAEITSNNNKQINSLLLNCPKLNTEFSLSVNMYVSKCMCMCVSVCMRVFLFVCVRVCICVCLCMCVCVRLCLCMCMFVSMCDCICVCVCVSACKCVYV